MLGGLPGGAADHRRGRKRLQRRGRQAGCGEVRMPGGVDRVGVLLRSRWPSWEPWGKGSQSFGKVSRETRRFVNYPPGDDDLNTTAREKVEGTG